MIASNNLLKISVTQKHQAASSKTAHLKKILSMLALGLALAAGAGSVFAQNQPAVQEIGDRWTSSPEYQEYLKLGGEKSVEARAIKEKAITEITQQVLAVYIQSFDPKYRELMDRKVKELPIGLQVLLANIDIKIKEKIKPGYDSMAVSRLNNHLFNYADSIYKGKGVTERNLDDLTKSFPELTNTEIIKTLRDTAKSYDNAAENQKAADAWRRINEMLKAIK